MLNIVAPPDHAPKRMLMLMIQEVWIFLLMRMTLSVILSIHGEPFETSFYFSAATVFCSLHLVQSLTKNGAGWYEG